jgi:hypothetical protein
MMRTVKALEQLPEEFLHRAGTLTVRLAEEGFELQTDPYGQWWAPTKTGKAFDQRDGLKNALRVSRVRLKDLMVMDLDHFAYRFHQQGTIYLPERLMVPVVSRGLGTWGAEYHELARDIWVGIVRKQ